MTHTLPLLGYANATFEPLAGKEKETAGPIFVTCNEQTKQGMLTMYRNFCS